jgi:diguanylate cyclase (GGDEF)-like protein
LPGIALARVEASCIEDVTRSPNLPLAAAAAAARLVTGFAFPVFVGTEVAAVLEFYLRERASFDPKILSVMASVGDLLGCVVEREQLKSAVVAQSLRDELTGLLNRRGLLEQGTRMYQRTLLGGGGLVATFCDLNGMKNINDELGHGLGDLAIRDGADVLRSTVTPGDLISRLGGDEFVVLTVNGDVDRAAVLEARVRSAVAEFNARGLRPYRLSISVGSAALDTGSPVPLEDLLAQADERMYEQKRERRSSGRMTIPVPPAPQTVGSQTRGAYP